VTTPKQPVPRFCRCGCGETVEHPKHYTAACKAIVRANRYKTANARRVQRGTKNVTDAPRMPVRVCRVCCDLPDRRDGTCKGCGREWAPERRSA